ncbi:MAG: hypothetical protein AAF235_07930 [Planctomycetota bacterium]
MGSHTPNPERSPLALSTAGLTRGSAGGPGSAGDPKQVLTAVASAGVSGIVLDATAPGFRPRDLDRSARRDLAAHLRRSELAFAGLDLFIPPRHFLAPDLADRASHAAAAALELASDITALNGGEPMVATRLPSDDAASLLAVLNAAAQRVGAVLVDHAPDREAADLAASLRIGIDPAVILAAARDVPDRVLRAGQCIGAVRLTDWNGSRRVPVGTGELDARQFFAALSIAAPEISPVIDVAGLPEPGRAARAAINTHAKHAAPGATI